MSNFLDNTKFSPIVTLRDKLKKHANPMCLESGDPDFPLPEHIAEALFKAVRDGHTHYPSSAGVPELRDAVVKKMSRDGINISDEWMIVTQSGSHGLMTAFTCLIENGGNNKFLVVQPNWGTAATVVKACGGDVCKVIMNYSNERGHFLSLDEFENVIQTEKPRAFILNSPHNPTGMVIGEADMKAIVKICAANNVVIIDDAAYEDIYYTDVKPKSAAVVNFQNKLGAKVISVHTFSKSYAMTGVRLGYLALSGYEKADGDQLMDRIKKYVLFSINVINHPVQFAGAAALNGSQECVAGFRKHFKMRRDILIEAVEASQSFSTAVPLGSFYLYTKCEKNGTQAADFAMELVDQHGLGCVAGKFFNMGNEDGFIRWAYTCPDEQIERACELIRTV